MEEKKEKAGEKKEETVEEKANEEVEGNVKRTAGSFKEKKTKKK